MFMHSDQMLQCDPMVPILPLERNWKPNVEIAPNCPRCASPNTKFCYYNNYSLSQPRYICKGCKRYWTKGGSLRNVPVGGGCRKSRRRSKSSRETRGAHQITSMKDYSKNSSSGVSSSSDGDSKNQQPDIDLAVVFAKFLNHNASFDGHQPNGDDNNSQKQAVHHSIPESYDMLQELPETEVFELQNLLAGDDHHHQMVLQDDLWADHDAAESKTPDFEWQPVVQLQQFESFPGEEYDDQLKVSASLMNGEDWGSFDLSGFGIFSKPSS